MSALVAAGWRRLLGRGVIVVVAAAVLALGLVRMNHVEASRSGVPTVFIGDSITHADTDDFTDLPGKRSWLRYVVTDDRTPWRYLANTAISGQTLGQMADRFDRDVLARRPQGVVIMGGTNDLRLGVPVEQSTADLRSMIDRAHAVGARVWVISPPPLQFDDWGDLQPLIDAERALAAELDVPFVEHDHRVGQGRWSSDDLTSDGVHPTRDGAQALGASVLDAVD